MHTQSPNKPKKFKQMLSARMLMTTVFWDMKGVLMVEFMQQGTTILSETLKKKKQKKKTKKKNQLCRAIQDERCTMLTAGVMLLHENACPHTAACTSALPEHFNWELFDHPPYGPDLTSINRLFTYPVLQQ
jgi:hypothetical protein